MLKDSVCFHVNDFDVQFDHCPIIVNIRSLYCHQDNVVKIMCHKNIKWDEIKKHCFVNNVYKIYKVSIFAEL